MTIHDKYMLLNLLQQWDETEIDCDGNCHSCYYNVASREVALDNCPIIIAYDMIYRKLYKPEDWNRKKG